MSLNFFPLTTTASTLLDPSIKVKVYRKEGDAPLVAAGYGRRVTAGGQVSA